MTDLENGEAPAGTDAAEADAWAEVERAWDDEERHRVYLERFRDLDGLAIAGRRYREVLAARPDDRVALRWRDEVVARAMAKGFASLPRARPAFARVPRWLRSLVIAVGIASFLGWLLSQLFLGRGP